MRSNASLDPSLAITGAGLNLNQGTIGYTHYFGIHRLAWVETAAPLAGLDGSKSRAAMPLSPKNLYNRALAPACDELGQPRISWHSFRHARGTWIGEVGESVNLKRNTVRPLAGYLENQKVNATPVRTPQGCNAIVV